MTPLFQRNISRFTWTSFILPFGKYFIDRQILSAYTSAVKQAMFYQKSDNQRFALYPLLILNNIPGVERT
jgi:hypothetical protein